MVFVVSFVVKCVVVLLVVWPIPWRVDVFSYSSTAMKFVAILSLFLLVSAVWAFIEVKFPPLLLLLLLLLQETLKRVFCLAGRLAI